ncbi:MAG: NAD(P)/FAD-dependent oxidoreductase [Bryobacterales bacterium]|nr:NAD(P)/FAD-dependent oxidoreductase [Bryobacterales bacterium]
MDYRHEGKRVQYDVIIVGGGPAGMSAALILGRCRRRVLICDHGRPRNRFAREMHGYLSRDCVPPAEFRAVACEQLKPYGVEWCDGEVKRTCTTDGGFLVTLANGTEITCRKLLLATGVEDELPRVKGIQALYGTSVHHCPYCDGWEHRDERIAVYGRGKNGAGLALSLTTWSADVVLCTDGMTRIPELEAQRLRRKNIDVRMEPIARLEGREGKLETIVFRDGTSIVRDAMFFSSGQHQQSPLAKMMGCIFNRKGTVRTNRLEGTEIPGLYVAGDASRDVQMVIVAAAEGAKAGFAINRSLQEEEFLTVA